MKNKYAKIFLNTGITFVFVLLICTAIQFIMWTKAERNVQESLNMMVSLSGKYSEQYIEDYLNKQYGAGKPFIPDLWIFDNNSIWTGKNMWTGK